MNIILGVETCVYVFQSEEEEEWNTVYAFNSLSRYWQMNTSLQCESTCGVGSGVEVTPCLTSG